MDSSAPYPHRLSNAALLPSNRMVETSVEMVMISFNIHLSLAVCNMESIDTICQYRAGFHYK